MQPLIRVNGLHYIYHDNSGKDIAALNDINLDIEAGEFIAIIGANGSGKSTLARHFNGILQPSQGDVIVNGANTRDPANWRDIRHNIAMVFQHPESQAVATTLEEDVAFGPENLGVPPDEIRRRVDWALGAVGLMGLQKRAPHHLSGGQKQRLALAGVLAMQPRCIVLDEATSMLDPSGRRGLRDIIKDLHKQGITIVMITQDMDEAAIAERVVVLSRGQIVRDNGSRKVMSDEPFLQSVGLDIPFITNLTQKLHAFNPEFPDDLLTINEIMDQFQKFTRMPVQKNRDSGRKYTDAGFNPVNGRPSNGAEKNQHQAVDGFIEARDIRYTYMRGTPFETEALRGVDFKVRADENVGVIGATGSGKSTLLQHLDGLLTPQAGELRIGNKDVTLKSTDLRVIRQQVALLFQQPEDQLFERYVADDIAYGPVNLGLQLSEVRQRVERALESVGLPLDEFRDRSIYALSGGERRRVALAGVLAMEPKVLVLDEASAGLDPRGRRDLQALLRTWQAQDERSIVWASHSMEEIARIAERVTIIHDGQVKLEGTPKQVFTQAELLTSCGLDVPQVVQVMKGVAELGLDVPVDVLTIEEAVPILKRVLAG